VKRLPLIILIALCVLAIIGGFLVASMNAHAASKKLPPHWKQWLQTCHAEQPKPGTYAGRGHWNNIWWHQTTNYTYPGGCGFTQLNWDDFKRPGQPKLMSDATPLEQVWACERIYQHYARIGGPAYGASVWDANKTIGFYGFAEGK